MNRYERMRYERGLTLGEVAEGSGLTRQTARAVERLGAGQHPIAPTAKALADFYGVSVAELLGLNGDDTSGWTPDEDNDPDGDPASVGEAA